MAKLQPVRGTHDLLPEESRRHRVVIDTAREVAALFGYAEYSTPIFEFTEVFARTLGDTSDIVTKEMYTFTDKGGDQITLRPEATAGIARALISGGLRQQLPLKVFCTGPMFRYERPQKGRLRQFHQIDVELVGVPGPLGDVEVIALGAEVLDRLGVLPRTELQLNTLGDTDSRKAYRTALVEYFSDHHMTLSEDSRDRLQRNPLRILDSKDQGDRRLIEDAPLFGDYLNAESQDFFATVQEALRALGIAFTVSPRLVRGLDYYCHTAFEFVTTELGAQGAVLAGGRYDGLVETMGGPPTPGTGWAAGIERLALMIAEPPPPPRPIAVVPVGPAATTAALQVAGTLRHAGLATELALASNLKRGLARANKIGARAAVLIGEDELARHAATVRDLDSGTQSVVRLDDLATHLAAQS